MKRGRSTTNLSTEEILHQAGDYCVARLLVEEGTEAAGSTLGGTEFKKRNVTVLAIERGNEVLPFPKTDERVLNGDCLLCYGKITEINDLSKK